MGGGVASRSLATDLRGWVTLGARVARSAIRRSPGAEFDAVVIERTPATLPGRLRFVALFRPAERVRGVTADTRLEWPGLSFVLRILGASLVALLSADRVNPSELTSRSLVVAAACLQAFGCVRRSRFRRAYLFRPYRLESPLIAAALMQQGIEVHVAVGTTPIAAHIRRMVGTTAILSTAYQIDEFRALLPLGAGGRYELWGPTELPEMEQQYAGNQLPDVPDIIGIYTQGFLARIRMGSISEADGRVHLELENRFLSTVEQFARLNPQVRLRIFPHPMERRYYRESGDHGFGSLLELDNVEGGFESDTSSILAFDTVGLGLTTVSTVGFDRLHLGLRTLFLVGESDLLDSSITSPFQQVFFRRESDLLQAIGAVRLESHSGFMERVFDGAYGDEWGPWAGDRPSSDASTTAKAE